MNDDDQLKKQLKNWHMETPSPDLAERIVARAITRPQHIPLSSRLQRGMIATFSEWQTGLAYKIASLALCAIIGFGIGMNQHEHLSLDVSALAFGTKQGGSLL